jgi:hypothetical protein
MKRNNYLEIVFSVYIHPNQTMRRRSQRISELYDKRSSSDQTTQKTALRLAMSNVKKKPQRQKKKMSSIGKSRSKEEKKNVVHNSNEDVVEIPTQNHNASQQHYVHLKQEKISSEERKLLDQIEKRPVLNLPHVNDGKQWEKIQDTVMTKLDLIWSRIKDVKDVDESMKMFTDCIYEETKSVCGTKVKKQHQQKKNRQKNKKKHELKVLITKKAEARKKWRKLKRASKNGNTNEVVTSFHEMMTAVRTHHDYVQAMKKIDKEKQKRKEQEKFQKDPYEYGKKLLDPPNKAKIAFGKAEADKHFKKTYSDENRSEEFKAFDGLPRKPPPEVAFNMAFPSKKQFAQSLWKKSNGSSPGFNGISYPIYKRCPKIREKLYLLQKQIWRKRGIPKEWRVIRVKMIPKSDDTSHPNKVRPISVSNSEGRLFWTMYQERMSDFFLENKYIDIRIQKGFLKGVAGCVEHATLLWEALRKARKSKHQICGIFLDLANAYGSVMHNMIQFALWWYHVPKEIAELLYNYYEGVCSQVHEGDWKSDWFHGDIGSLQGCTAAAMIFIIAFQLLLDIHEWLMKDVKSGYTIPDTTIHLSKPSYADDVALIERNPVRLQQSCNAFQQALDWSKTMKLKPTKCFSFAYKQFRKGTKKRRFEPYENKTYSAFDPKIKVNGEDSQFMAKLDKHMFKHLGRLFQLSQKDNWIRDKVAGKLEAWLEVVNKCMLTGSQKVWITNNLVISKVLWEMMIQNFPTCTVKEWQNVLVSFYKQWTGLAKPAETSVFFRSRENFGFNMKHLVDCNEQQQVIKWMILKESKDPQAREMFAVKLEWAKEGQCGTGRKKDNCPLIRIEKLLSSVEHRKMRGEQRENPREGLKVTTKLSEREDVLATLKKEQEEKRLVPLHDYQMQTKWLKWSAEDQRGFEKSPEWRQMMLNMSDRLVKFWFNAMTETLPSPDNLKRWGVKKGFSCGLCKEKERAVTSLHILAGCPYVLLHENKKHGVEDRYTWRHNNVLNVLKKAMEKKLQKKNAEPLKPADPIDLWKRPLTFVQPGKAKFKKTTKREERRHLLDSATDWKCGFDLPDDEEEKTYEFPMEACPEMGAQGNPDGFIWSKRSKVCILIELTCPMEENILKWQAKKREKYLKLAKSDDYEVIFMVWEVGARGWIPTNVSADLKRLGFTTKERQKVITDCRLAALRSSYVIWVQRFNKNFLAARMQI